jgi:hypothetical protein
MRSVKVALATPVRTCVFAGSLQRSKVRGIMRSKEAQQRVPHNFLQMLRLIRGACCDWTQYTLLQRCPAIIQQSIRPVVSLESKCPKQH